LWFLSSWRISGYWEIFRLRILDHLVARWIWVWGWSRHPLMYFVAQLPKASVICLKNTVETLIEIFTKISIFVKNFDFCEKFRFLWKILIFVKNFDFCEKFRFLWKILIFVKNFDFCEKFPFFAKNFDFSEKFPFFVKILDFYHKFRFLCKISILSKISILLNNFHFGEKFRFLWKFSIFMKHFHFCVRFQLCQKFRFFWIISTFVKNFDFSEIFRTEIFNKNRNFWVPFWPPKDYWFMINHLSQQKGLILLLQFF